MKRNRFISHVLIFVFTLLVFGCEKETSIIAEVVLSPVELVLNDGETGVLYLSVQPAVEFKWNLSSKPAWLEITPGSGSINKNIVELQVVPNQAGLSQGTHVGVVEIITNGAGRATTYVHFNVGARPVASVNPTTVSYSANESEKTITVSNTGNGVLSWELKSLPSWISIDVSSGTLDQGQNIGIKATANRSGLPVGTQSGQAVLSSNSVQGDLTINFSLEVPAKTILVATPAPLHFGYFESEKTITLTNQGNIASNWTWSNQNAYLSANPASGSLSPGSSIQVSVIVDRTGFTTQTINAQTTFTNSGGDHVSLPIIIDHFKEEKWLIEGRVIDAEYDRVNDLIVVVSEVPNKLWKYNPATETFSSLALNMIPTCVSVSQDGQYAAVGHNGKFTYVNLTSMETVQMYNVTANAADIILAPNNWVYVFPKENQHVRIRCIDLSTGEETQHTGNSIYQGAKAKLHTSGNYIYAANNGVSPSNVDKIDIRNGTAQYMYRSPYHGDYAFSGDIWISDDGNRIFARSRNVFNASENQANDLTYNGVLAGQDLVKTLDHSTNSGKVYAIFGTGTWGSGPPDNIVMKYNSGFLAPLGTITLPGFLIPDGSGGGVEFESEGHFGFFNSAGTKFYVLVKAREGSGAQNEWAIATVNVD